MATVKTTLMVLLTRLISIKKVMLATLMFIVVSVVMASQMASLIIPRTKKKTIIKKITQTKRLYKKNMYIQLGVVIITKIRRIIIFQLRSKEY